MWRWICEAYHANHLPAMTWLDLPPSYRTAWITFCNRFIPAIAEREALKHDLTKARARIRKLNARLRAYDDEKQQRLRKPLGVADVYRRRWATVEAQLEYETEQQHALISEALRTA